MNMQECSSSLEASDGRTVFAVAPNGQVRMPRVGNYCLTMLGDGAGKVDVSLGADVSATSSNAQHSASNAVDGSAQSYWASGFDPASVVDMILDFGAAKQIQNVEIDWERPPLVIHTCARLGPGQRHLPRTSFVWQAFELQVAIGGVWSSIFATSSNSLNVTRYLGPSVSGAALRVRMTKPHPTLGNSDGHAL